MADDLDDFFDEIEEAEAEVTKEEGGVDVDNGDDDGEGEGARPEQAPQSSVPSSSAEAEVDGNDENDENDDDHLGTGEEEPPKKRAKREAAAIAAPAAPIRPRGVVVAASSSVVRPVKQSPATTTTTTAAAGPQIGPAVPPGSAANASIRHAGPPPPTQPYSGIHQPPLPPGPPPPPPPPPLPPYPAPGDGQSSSAGAAAAKPVRRVAAGKAWVDPTLAEWPENDYRLFVGNLSRDVTDAQLYSHFQPHYPSLAMAKIVKDGKTGVSKGFGFVSFLQPLDCAKAVREQDQKWLGSRPIRVKRSDWKDRNFNEAEKKKKKEAKVQKRFGGR